MTRQKWKDPRMIAAGVGVWMVGLAATITIAFADPALAQPAADTAFGLAATAVIGTSSEMINKGKGQGQGAR